jgi:hypothetical protein
LQVVKRSRTSGPSIKVGCKSYFSKKVFFNGQVEIVYQWKHINHDHFESESFINESRLPVEVKKWIIDAVELYKDWKTIMAILHLNDEELDQVCYYILVFSNRFAHLTFFFAHRKLFLRIVIYFFCV